MLRMIIESVGASVLAISTVTVTGGALDSHIESFHSNIVESIGVVDEAGNVLANVDFSIPNPAGLSEDGGIVLFEGREADWEVRLVTLSFFEADKVLCYNIHDRKQFKSTYISDADESAARQKSPEQRQLGYSSADAACDRYDGQSMEDIGGYRDESG